jgi:RND family efflux transporter MFP subunit
MGGDEMEKENPESGGSMGIGHHSRLRRLLPTGLIIVLLGMIGLFFFWIRSEGEVIRERNQASLKTDQEAINVVALTMIPGTIRDRLVLPGVTKSWVEMQLLAEVGGRVTHKTIPEGTAVVKDQIIARIDPRDYRNAHLSAKAAFELALSDFERLENLYQRKAIPLSQLDGAKAKVETTRSAMNTAALEVERCLIKAPFEGMINRIFVEEGQYLKDGDPVAEVLQMKRLKVRVGIPESDVDAVRKLEKFNVTVDALNGQSFIAHKHFLSRTADSSARLYSLDLCLDNPEGAILPDMFVRVEIIKQEVQQSLSVPLYAVVNHNGGQAVYVVENESAMARPVMLGLLDGWRVEVKRGLQLEDRVIIVGHRSVKNGDPIRVIRSVEDPEEIIQ